MGPNSQNQQPAKPEIIKTYQARVVTQESPPRRSKRLATQKNTRPKKKEILDA